MNLLRIVALLTYAFGIYACAAMLLDFGRAGDAGGGERGPRPGATDLTPAERWNRIVLTLCLLWFCVLVLRALHDSTWALVGMVVLSFLFPPLLMQSTLLEVRERGTDLRGPAWRVALAAAWVLSPALALYLILAFYDLVPRPPSMGPAFGAGIGGMFVLAGTFCALALTLGPRREESADERAGRRWTVRLYLALLVFAAVIGVARFERAETAAVLNFAGSTLPLLFIFTSLYHESRFRFVDLFVKRGVLFVLCLVLLVPFFAFVAPLLLALDLGPTRSWVLAVFLLPVGMSLPWLYGRLAEWLDGAWFGRTLRPGEAVRQFLALIGPAVTRQELVERAERGLETIFRAPARVEIEGAPARAEFAGTLELPVRPDGAVAGAVRLGPRASRKPYFSEDIALLGSLADVLARMLENLRLQERRQEQESLARELSLAASRSELKALRAQINPHFLFNALNAVAGLIPRDPVRADLTLERLAEVFRYTLRGSESEWTALEDELEFARCYLEVESARFGDRLAVSVRSGDGVAGARVPTMMLQTLVENAVKHGVSAVRGPARIEVEARREHAALVIEVADSGPGFTRQDAPPRGERYGLKNVRERLAGHFGERGRLVVRRDEGRGMTVVAIELPLEAHALRAGVP